MKTCNNWQQKRHPGPMAYIVVRRQRRFKNSMQPSILNEFDKYYWRQRAFRSFVLSVGKFKNRAKCSPERVNVRIFSLSHDKLIACFSKFLASKQ